VHLLHQNADQYSLLETADMFCIISSIITQLIHSWTEALSSIPYSVFIFFHVQVFCLYVLHSEVTDTRITINSTLFGYFI